MSSVKLRNHTVPFLEYLEIEKGRSAKTVRNYDFYLRRFLDWAGDPDTQDVTVETVRKYRLHLNRIEDPSRGTLKKNTQNYHLIALRSFLKYLARHDVETLAPEKIELARQGSRDVAFLDVEDVERLLSAPMESDLSASRHSAPPIVRLRDRSILEMLFSTGLRVSELAALQHGDIHLQREEFSVRGKGDKVRVVFVSHQARYWLGQYLDAREDTSPFLFVRHDRAKARSEEPQPLTPRSIERLVKFYAAAAGITKNVTPHTLRHSFATDLLMNGADIRSVQAMLGHSSITTTQVYTHVTNKQLRDVHQAFHGTRRSSAGDD